jgi:hypothetical protein
MRHGGGGGEAVVSSGNFGGSTDRELDPYKLKQLSDRIAQIGAIRSNERGAEQQKHKEIHRIQQLIKSLEAMDVEEAEDVLDKELERLMYMYVDRRAIILLTFDFAPMNGMFDYLQGTHCPNGQVCDELCMEVRRRRRKRPGLSFQMLWRKPHGLFRRIANPSRSTTLHARLVQTFEFGIISCWCQSVRPPFFFINTL